MMRTLYYYCFVLWSCILQAQTNSITEIVPIFISKDSIQLNGLITTIDKLDSITQKIVIFKRQQAFENEYNIGINNLGDKKYLEAIVAFNKALKLNPKFYKIYSSRAIAYNESNNILKAIEDIDTFAIHEQLNEQISLLYANIKYGMKDNEGAKVAYQQVLRINSMNAKANYYLGVIAFEDGKYEEALKYFDISTKTESSFVQAYHDKASTKRKLDDFKGAYEDYSKAIQIDPKYCLAYINRANINMKLKQFDSAINDFNMAASIEPSNYLIYNGRGNAKFENGDFQGAIHDFDQTLTLKPEYVFAYNNRAAAKYKLKDYKGALEDGNMAIKLNANYGYAFLNRGIAKQMLRDQIGACADWNQAKLLGIKSAEIYLNQDCE